MTDAPNEPVFVTEDEAAVVTRENPKGRLLEFCQHTKCGKPKLTLTSRSNAHGVEMQLRIEGRPLASGLHWARTRMLAEQLAARALLTALATREDVGEVDEELTAEEEATLPGANPKGRLLEQCVVRRLVPVFEVRPIVTTAGARFEGSAHVVLEDGEEVWSALRRGASAKLVEHAVAKSLLAELDAELEAQGEDAPEVGAHPRSVLNELHQKGQLRAFGFAVVRTDGPPHAPMFHTEGYAERSNGERLTATPVAAPSKKMGERLVALKLVRLLSGRA